MYANKIFFFLSLNLFTSPAAAAKSSSADILINKLEANLKSQDEYANIEMTIVDSNGQSKTRELDLKKRSPESDKQEVLLRIKRPADLKGVGLLSVLDNEFEQQWLYLPSQKKSRRIASTNKKEKFLDSEFSYEDFSASTYKSFTNKVILETILNGKRVKVVESITGYSASPYKKIITWIDATDYIPVKTEYYDPEGQLLKVMEFSDYKKFGGGAWRAQTVKVQNVQNNRKTLLKLSELKINTGIDQKEFSKQALESF